MQYCCHSPSLNKLILHKTGIKQLPLVVDTSIFDLHRSAEDLPQAVPSGGNMIIYPGRFDIKEEKTARLCKDDKIQPEGADEYGKKSWIFNGFSEKADREMPRRRAYITRRCAGSGRRFYIHNIYYSKLKYTGESPGTFVPGLRLMCRAGRCARRHSSRADAPRPAGRSGWPPPYRSAWSRTV